MHRYLFFLLFLAGCKPAGMPSPAEPAWHLWVSSFLGGVFIGYSFGEWLTKRKFHKFYLDYTNMFIRLKEENEKVKEDYQEKIKAILNKVYELEATVNRLKNERRY